MTWAVEKDLPALQKLVLLMLANHANGHTGRCDPSLKRLAIECGMSRDSIIRNIKKLEESNNLTVIREKDGDINKRNYYILRMPAVASQGRASDDPGVVADSNQGSSTQLLGVVADSDPNQEYKPGSKTKAGGINPPTSPKKTNSLKKRFEKHIDGMPESWRIHCKKKRPFLDPDDVYEEFSDWWLASASPTAYKLDWDAAFRTWVGKQFKTDKERANDEQQERQKYML